MTAAKTTGPSGSGVGTMVLLLLLAALLSVSVCDAASLDLKSYSYICLQYDQTLCLGISPGVGEPYYDPNNIYYLQVKSRTRTEFTNTDYKKTRWDADYTRKSISLSRFPELCMAKESGGDRVGLFPCNITQNWDRWEPDGRYGLWDLDLFQTNINNAGTLELIGSSGSMCLTVMHCKANGRDWCDPGSQQVAWDVSRDVPVGLRKGSYLRFRPCFDAVGGDPKWANVQLWRQKLDCAPGCSPYEQNNNVCDEACNVDQCDYDNGKCQTRRPTPPTYSPTLSPTNAPTPLPTSQGPSVAPSTSIPSVAPSKAPTGLPTRSPIPGPTRGPTLAPSTSPTVACPPPGELEFCATKTQAQCTKGSAVKDRCVWCLDKCSPRANNDPRVCTIPNLYAHCKAQCPSDAQRRKCPKFGNQKQCTRKMWQRNNCQWCGPKMACLPGKDARMCTGDPTVFDHCGTLSPTGAPCPPKKVVNSCVAAKVQGRCKKAKCTWCPGQPFPCRPGTNPGVCDVPDVISRQDLISKHFSHCGLLHPTQRPTLQPTAPTAEPTTRPSSSPSTTRPSKAPTSRPSKTPTVSRPTKSPTNTPTKSPTFSAPSKTPTHSSPTKSPTSAPTKMPTKSPTERPTTKESARITLIPTSDPSAAPTTSKPTESPVTSRPSKAPSTPMPSGAPSKKPTIKPTSSPTTSKPTASPTTTKPSAAPSTSTPSSGPTTKPSVGPTNQPSASPTNKPSASPITSEPSAKPTTKPSVSPSTSKPSMDPTSSPSTAQPSVSPSAQPDEELEADANTETESRRLRQ